MMNNIEDLDDIANDICPHFSLCRGNEGCNSCPVYICKDCKYNKKGNNCKTCEYKLMGFKETFRIYGCEFWVVLCQKALKPLNIFNVDY